MDMDIERVKLRAMIPDNGTYPDVVLVFFRY